MPSHASFDPLTALPGQQAFTATLDAELDRAARYDYGLTLIVFGLDGFARLNGEGGRREGDRILCLVADAVRTNLRRSDVGGRIGGDEFAVLLLHTGRHAGERFLSRFRRALAILRERGDLPAGFGLSAGYAHFPDEALTPDGLFRLADQGHHASKRGKVSTVS